MSMMLAVVGLGFEIEMTCAILEAIEYKTPAGFDTSSDYHAYSTRGEENAALRTAITTNDAKMIRLLLSYTFVPEGAIAQKTGIYEVAQNVDGNQNHTRCRVIEETRGKWKT